MKTGIFFIAAIIAAAVTLGGCTGKANAGSQAKADAASGATASTSKYSPGEMTNYNGIPLQSVNSFRENSIKGVQQIDPSKYTLKVKGLVTKKLSLGYADITNLPPVKKLVTIYCVEGWSVNVLWEGVTVKSILQKSGVPGKPKTLILRAADGYSTSLPLHEVLGKDMILAYKANGLELPAKLGFPLILVAEDKWGYKWARWITELELSDNTNYKGY
ncbi:MAG: hypothetical protein A2Y33_05720 [Spirochaetes bacterium GWF1_51_8]|nr:MAG: hypothetical protein A2Y33_05720 [Spirochaetes bacterium GWF1_51_8]